MNEQKAREYIRKLRRFYTNALACGVVNIGLILIWAISGGGYFWPIWPITGCAIGLGIHAFSLGLIPQLEAFVPFMAPEWEEREVRRLMTAGPKGKQKEEKKEEKKEATSLRIVAPTEKKVGASTVKKKVSRAKRKTKA